MEFDRSGSSGSRRVRACHTADSLRLSPIDCCVRWGLVIFAVYVLLARLAGQKSRKPAPTL